MRLSARAADALLFGLVLLVVGWFHQGGGWNQNARFALVRAIVDGRTLFLDDWLVYGKEGTHGSLSRASLDRGNFERDGAPAALAWSGPAGRLVPIDAEAAAGRRLVAIDAVAASGDVAFFAGHFHPNKAPGTSLAAVPAYGLLRMIEGATGIAPDAWATLTLNAWLTSWLSVGLATALGAVAVAHLARGVASEGAARVAALVFAFGTMALPCGTMLLEHNPIGACLAGALCAVETARSRAEGGRRRGEAAWLHAAGFLAGFAAITNYTMALLVPVLASYAAARTRRRWSTGWFAAGVAWPFILVCAYNVACFGTPWTTNYAWENPLFRTGNRLLGVFAPPRADVALLLLVSPFRGLFFTSPVLLAAVAGVVLLWQRPEARPLAVVTTLTGVFVLAVNASFNGWDGGWTAVPRYLGPAVPLLSVAVAPAFDRWRVPTAALALVSVAMQLVLTAVDPQVPIGDVGVAGVPASRVFFTNPLTRYVLPLLTTGRAWPLIDESIDATGARVLRQALQRGVAAAEAEREATAVRGRLRETVERGEGRPLPLGGVIGPVSANPIGVYEGGYFSLFAAGSREARGNSFNVGEMVFGSTAWSLVPLVAMASAAVWALLLPAPGRQRKRQSSKRSISPSPQAQGRKPQPFE